jgi:hypothetical protein
MFAVGPESVGATPGPVCYSKGGSTLAITDCNVVLGRIQAAYFPAIFGPHVSGRYWEGTAHVVCIVYAAVVRFVCLLVRGGGWRTSVTERAAG